MVIAKETKERFVKMLDERKIIVLCEMGKSKNNNYKFIGADSYGRLDFTPMIAQISGNATRNGNDVQLVSVLSNSGASIIVDALVALSEEGIVKPIISRDDEYFRVREKISTFYI